jgi:hypothetical protein
MSRSELLQLMAAQIFAGIVTKLPSNTPEEQMKAVADTAVKAAKAIEDAVAKSIGT